MNKLVSVTFMAIDSKGSTRNSPKSKPMIMTEETARLLQVMLATTKIGSGGITPLKTGDKP